MLVILLHIYANVHFLNFLKQILNPKNCNVYILSHKIMITLIEKSVIGTIIVLITVVVLTSIHTAMLSSAQ